MFFIFIASFFVGNRELSVGTDTLNYVAAYEGASYSLNTKYELGFSYLLAFLNYFYFDYSFFLGFCFVFITLFVFFAFNRFNYSSNDNLFFIYSLVFFVFLYSSDWFLTATINGLRQGMALALIYFGVSFLKTNNNKFFICLFILSTLFHKSSLLLLPFLIPIFFNSISLKNYTFIFIFFSIGYIFSINELFVKYFSIFSGSSLYLDIYNYALDDWGDAPWIGFNLKFFMYTVFWYFLTIFMINRKLFKVNTVENVVFVAKVYCMLCVYYFLFGYGAFSNRWAFASWFFLPLLQSTVIVSLSFSSKIKLIFGFFVFLPYLYFLSNFLSL
jgi:hypothetical protein